MNDLLKKYVSTSRKNWFHCLEMKKCKKIFLHLVYNWYLKNRGEIVSTRQKIRFHLPEWSIYFKNTFPLDRKELSLAEMSEKKNKKWFPLARKFVSTNRNAVLV